jgi:broad specificity phosphatase PhoE
MRAALRPSLAFLASALAMPILMPGGAARAEPPMPIVDALKGPALLQALRQGGYVVFFRHVRTEKDEADQISAKMGDCATQRMLSEAGWRDARAIGGAFARLAIPVGDVVASEYCRAWQTADLAFGRYVKNPALNFEPAEKYTASQNAAMRARMRALLAAPPPAGKNTVLVGHDDPFQAATGIYPEPMGVAYVTRPDGRGGFAIRAKVDIADWAALDR